jgi:autotransporter-associated beta strand protein
VNHFRRLIRAFNHFSKSASSKRHLLKRALPLRLELLEDRTVPSSTVTLASGVLAYTAGTSDTNNLTFSFNSATGVFSFVENGGVTINTSISGSTGSGTSAVTVPDTAVTSVQLNLANAQNDILNLQSLNSADPVSFSGGAGNDTISISSNAPSNSGDLLGIQNGTITIAAGTGSNQLNVSESGSTTSDTLLVTSSQISSSVLSFAINFTGSFGGNINLFGPTTDGSNVAVQSTLANAVTDIVSAGKTNITVGNSGSVQAIAGTLNLEDTPSFNSIIIDDSADATARTVTMSTLGPNPNDSKGDNDAWGQIIGLAPAAINFEYFDTNDVKIDAGTGNNTFDFQSVGATTVLNTGSGNDTVSVGSAANTLVDVVAPLNVHGQGGTDQLIVNDQGTTGVQGYTVTGSIIFASSALQHVNYSGISLLTLNGSSGPSSYSIQSTGASTTINTGAGNDTVTVGSTTNTLAGIAAALSINGQGGTDQLSINDQGTTGAQTYTLTKASVSASSAGGAVSFSGISTLTINGGTGPNTYTVQGTANSTTVNAGAGNDTVTVGGASNTLAGIAAALSVNGQGGTDALNLNDQGTAGPQTYTVSSTTVTATSDGAAVNYSGIAALTLNGGTGNDTYNVLSTGNATTINTGAGNDTVTVGSANNTLAGIAGALSVNGQGGMDQLSLNDQIDTVARSGTLGTSSITGFGMAGGINYSAFASLILQGGSGNDSIMLSGTNANNSVAIQDGSGQNQVTIASASAGSTVTVNGQSGNDTVRIQSIAGATVTLTGTIATLAFNGASGDASTVTANNLTINQGILAVAGTTPTLTGTGTLHGSTSEEADAGARLTISALLSGTGGLSKTGAGTVVLTGNNSYSGQTTVGQGTLEIDGKQQASPIVVQTGATLQGHGSAGAVTIKGGTLIPGPNGNLQITSLSATQGQYQPTLLSGGGVNEIVVSGAANLTGLKLVLNVTAQPAPGQQLTVLQAQSVTGAFVNAAQSGSVVDATAPAGDTPFAVGYNSASVTLTAFSDTPDFVKAIYQELLHRAADPSGLAGWEAFLQQNGRTSFVNQISQSTEYENLQTEVLFTEYLHRSLDPSQLAAFAGQSAMHLRLAIVSSPEYFQVRGGNTPAGFINAVYEDALGRPVDSSGLSVWEATLAAGGPAAVANGIFSSQEYLTDLLGGFYQEFLGRNLDAGGLAAFLPQLQSGVDERKIIAALLGSQEYSNDPIKTFPTPLENYVSRLATALYQQPVDPFTSAAWTFFLYEGHARNDVVRDMEDNNGFRAAAVKNAFTTILNRPADQGGLSFWTSFMAAGNTIEAMDSQLFGSAEFFADNQQNSSKFLNSVYQIVLNRPIDSGGLSFWTQQLKTLSRQQVAFDILSSPEAEKDRIQSFYVTFLKRPADSGGLSHWLQLLQNGGRDEDVLAGLLGSTEYFNEK